MSEEINKVLDWIADNARFFTLDYNGYWYRFEDENRGRIFLFRLNNRYTAQFYATNNSDTQYNSYLLEVSLLRFKKNFFGKRVVISAVDIPGELLTKHDKLQSIAKSMIAYNYQQTLNKEQTMLEENLAKFLND